MSHRVNQAAAATLVLCVSIVGPARAQLLSETVDGTQRVCRYAPATNVLSVGTARVHRVGVGENCPFTPPLADPNLTVAPPTAQLSAQSVNANRRNCVYSQLGRAWTIAVPVASVCPLNAGTVTARIDTARRR